MKIQEVVVLIHSKTGILRKEKDIVGKTNLRWLDEMFQGNGFENRRFVKTIQQQWPLEAVKAEQRGPCQINSERGEQPTDGKLETR